MHGFQRAYADSWTVLVAALIVVSALGSLPGRDIVGGPSPQSSPAESVSPFSTYGAILATVPLGGKAGSPLFDAVNGNVYVPIDPAPAPGNVTVVSSSTDSIIAIIPVGVAPQRPVLDPASENLFVSNFGSGTVSVISTGNNSLLTTIPVGGDPWEPTLDPASGKLYVPNSGSNSLSVINTSTNEVTATIPLGASPLTPAVDDKNGELFVVALLPSSGPAPGVVLVVSTTTESVVANLSVGRDPSAATFDSLSGQVLVASQADNEVTVISASSNDINSTVPTTGLRQPLTGAVAPSNGDFYVPGILQSSFGLEGGVSVLSGADYATVTTIPVGALPQTPIYDSSSGNLFVANGLGASVSVISSSSNTVIAAIPVGLYPSIPAIDVATDRLFVASAGSDSLTIISGSGPWVTLYTVAFVERGLPPGTRWSATLAGSTRNTSGYNVSFAQANGTYDFEVPAVAGFVATMPSGSVAVTGSGVLIHLFFVPASGSTFLGLPAIGLYLLAVALIAGGFLGGLYWGYRRGRRTPAPGARG